MEGEAIPDIVVKGVVKFHEGGNNFVEHYMTGHLWIHLPSQKVLVHPVMLVLVLLPVCRNTLAADVGPDLAEQRLSFPYLLATALRHLFNSSLQPHLPVYFFTVLVV